MTCSDRLPRKENVVSIPKHWRDGSNGEDIIKEISRAEHDELFKSVYAYGQSAVRTLLILNGAAALALLAFVGKTAADGAVAIAAAMVPALWCFFGGAACAGIVSALSYIAQIGYLAESWEEQKRPHRAWQIPLAYKAHIISIVFYVLGFTLFVIGGVMAGQAIKTLPAL
jgi:MFS family permease